MVSHDGPKKKSDEICGKLQIQHNIRQRKHTPMREGVLVGGSFNEATNQLHRRKKEHV